MRGARSRPVPLALLLPGSVGLSLALSGCITTWAVQESMGTRATLEFSLAGTESPRPLIYWHELPAGNETALFLAPPLTDCAAAEFYANPAAGSLHRLSGKPTGIHPPADVPDEGPSDDPWRLLPAERCAVILSVGPRAAAGSSGLTASTRQGEFFRFAFPMPRDVPANMGALVPAALFSPLDIFVTPLGGIAFVGARMSQDDPPTDATTVSFDFPDGTRREVSLTYSEARELLEKRLPGSDMNGFNFEIWRSTRFWTLAALLRLELNFRVVAHENAQDQQRVLVHVGGWTGFWHFDLRDGSKTLTDLRRPTGTSGYIRFAVTDGQRTDLRGDEATPGLPAISR